MNKLGFTVIIPCYNDGRYLEETVNSVLSQRSTPPPAEPPVVAPQAPVAEPSVTEQPNSENEQLPLPRPRLLNR